MCAFSCIWDAASCGAGAKSSTLPVIVRTAEPIVEAAFSTEGEGYPVDGLDFASSLFLPNRKSKIPMPYLLAVLPRVIFLG